MFVQACGPTWSEALKGLDDKATAAQQGDIIVTEDSARKMSQPTRRQKFAKEKLGGERPCDPQTAPRILTPTASATLEQADPFGRGQRSYPRIRAG